MADLCAAALEHGMEVGYLRAIIRKRHLIPGSPPTEIEGWPWPVKVHTLGRFEVVTNGKPWRPAARARRRPLQLLKALIASGATDVSEQKLMEGLWPQAEGDAARQDFDTTLYRLRKLLGVAGALVLREGRLSVDPRLCWVDATALERTFARLEAALLAAPDEVAIAQLVEHVLELYRGPFLGDDEDLPAGRAFRERLRHRVGRLLGKAGQLLEEQGDRERVMDWYERALEADDLLEPIRRRLAVLRSPERF